jgi:hypothetical protein
MGTGPKGDVAHLFARQQDIADRLKLTEVEVGAIADQENLSAIDAAGWGAALAQSRRATRRDRALASADNST